MLLLAHGINASELTDEQLHNILTSNVKFYQSNTELDLKILSQINQCNGIFDLAKKICHIINPTPLKTSSVGQSNILTVDFISQAYEKLSNPDSRKKAIPIGGDKEMREFLLNFTVVGSVSSHTFDYTKDSIPTADPHINLIINPELIRKKLADQIDMIQTLLSLSKNDSIQLFYKGLPISYEKILTSLVEIYIKNLPNNIDIDIFVNGYLENCFPKLNDKKDRVKLFKELKDDLENVTRIMIM